MLRLLIEDSEGKSKLAPIHPDGAPLTIGRKEGNSIRLKERNVSRQHARIFSTREGLFVEPVAARYGMRVNSKKISGPTKIELGDEIAIGDYRLYIQDENKPVLREDESSQSAVMPIATPQQPRFVVVSSNFAGREYSVTQTQVTIGRQPNCELCIEHQSVSARHAEVCRNARGGFEIKDLGSSNGTKINGLVLSNTHELMSGDMVILGHVMMRYCAPGELWYFNFGGVEEQRSVRSYRAMIVVLLCLLFLVLLGFAWFVWQNQQEKPSVNSPSTDVQANGGAQNHLKVFKLILDCQDETKKGNFVKAQSLCDEASEIDAKEPKLIVAQDELRREMRANHDLESIREYLDDGKCLDALSGIDALPRETWAYRQMEENKLRERAITCRADELEKRIKEALQNNQNKEAEQALILLQNTLDAGDERLKGLSAEVHAKTRPGSVSSRGQRGGNAAAAASSPSSASKVVDAEYDSLEREYRDAKGAQKLRKGKQLLRLRRTGDVACQVATLMKHFEANEVCDIVRNYRIAVSLGDPCKGAEAYIEQHGGACR